MAVEEKRNGGDEKDLVELRGVARDAVPEVHSPGHPGGFAVGVVRQTGEEAANATDCDAKAKRQREEIACAGGDALNLLGQLDGEPSAKQAADDGFAAAGKKGLRPGDMGARSLLEQPKQPAAHESAHDSGGDDSPPLLFRQQIAIAAARALIDREAKRITERLEDRVEFRMRVQMEHTGSVARCLPAALCCSLLSSSR